MPFRCIICKSHNCQKINLCHECLVVLPWITHCCKICSIPIPSANADTICGNCLKKPPAFDAAIVLFHYEKPVKKLIHQAKFNHNFMNLTVLSQLLTQHVKKMLLSTNHLLILPVPLHKKRLKNRGFNQSLEIAKIISKNLKIPLNKKSVIRKKATQPQAQMPADLRFHNVKNAFTTMANFENKNILLVDDVMTTGQTVNEASIALKKAGASNIVVCALARTN